MKALVKFSLVFLLILTACTDVIVKKENTPDEDEDEIIRILDDRFPLMKAVKEGKLDEIKRLLKIEVFKKGVNQQDEEGNTAFIFAAEQGFEDILAFLLEEKADPILSDFKKRTPLMIAAYRGKINIINRLLEIDVVKESINDQDKDGNTAFFFAAKKGYEDILDLLLEAKADPNLSNFRKRTPLMIAAYKGKVNIVNRLLQIDIVKEAINDQDKDGNTGFLLAARKGHEDTLELLLQAKADPVLNNFKERTPLMESVIRGRMNTVIKLLQIKSVRDNINATDKDGNTALSLARQEGYKQIASLLLEAGAISQPIKDTFLNIKSMFKQMFFPEQIREENQLRKTASESEDKKNNPQSFFERIASFLKNLF